MHFPFPIDVTTPLSKECPFFCQAPSPLTFVSRTLSMSVVEAVSSNFWDSKLHISWAAFSIDYCAVPT